MADVSFIVEPRAALLERRGLFEAVGRLYGARFTAEAEDAGRLAGRIRFGDGDTPEDRLPTLALLDGDRRPATVSLQGASAVPRPFRDRALADSGSAAIPARAAERASSVLARTDGGPVWAEQTPTHQVAAPAPAELEPDETLRSRFRPGRFSELLPLLAFVRRHSCPGWQGPRQTASFLIDDPNLHALRYGFVDFRRLAVDAREHGYHVAFATIPLDLWWASRRAVRLFRQAADVLSLLMHGNDHTLDELGGDLSESRRIEMLGQALLRVDRFEEKYGVRVARVMAPPHGECAHETIGALLRLEFEALCVSRTHPWLDGNGHGDALAGSRAVHLVDGEFPLLLRHHLRRDRDDLVFRAFLGQPLIVYGHHGDLLRGPAALRETAAFINGLGVTDWRPLDRIARSMFSTCERNSHLSVRPRTQRVELTVPAGLQEVSVDLAGDGPTGALIVESDGRRSTGPGPHSAAGDELTIRIRGARTLDPSAVAAGLMPGSAWPVVRRVLTESRDRLAPVGSALGIGRNAGATSPTDPVW
jgi:hypothetical protein